jgi:hypothetical protein
MRVITKRLPAVFAAAGLGLGLAGCSQDQTASQVSAMNATNLQRLTNLYAAYMAAHGWQGPKTEADLKEFIKAFDPNKLAMMHVDAANVDAIFVSERDGKPFKVRYGQGGGPGAAVAVTFEQEGHEGKKQVGLTNGTQEDADPARYNELWSGKAAPSGGRSSGPPPGGPGGPPPGGGGRPTGRPAGAPTGPPGP